ncbi:UNVERIFIED_CONTAM: hypothetical protein Slati_2155700 [Sesamum latifolium]|uniref:Endonuclease/exonuclease/phosphatase domain-containing protein n=1 Tax=Sesamum latifolium TaxID=2727402 RepID=A0AAW2WW47_9LAMI
MGLPTSLKITSFASWHFGDKAHRTGHHKNSLPIISGWCHTHSFDTIVDGRMLIIWNPRVIDLQPEDISPQVIHCRVMNKSSQLSFYVLFTYGLYSIVNRRSMWEKLLDVGQPLTLPWLILGDFNCVKSTAEKQLGVVPIWHELKDFNDCCLSLGLTDAPTTGCYYTWYSNSDSNPVWCKLDRVLLNNEWLEAGLQCSAHFNPPGCLSDHSPVAVDIGQEFVAYFISLLGTEAQTLPVDNDVFEWGPKLSSEQASELCKSVTLSEVKQAIFQICDNKAPGPDGFSACFFKRAWSVVGDQVCLAVMDFFRSGRLIRQLNHSIIALVPKSEHSPTVADYRPISCCNVIYKAITKIISDRLAHTLEQLIDRSQAAFVGGWSITDNIFLA